MQGRWIWLFPMTYLIHMTEEYYGGEGFYRWISRWTGAYFTAHDFVVLNAIAWFVMVGATGLVALFPSCRFLLAAFGGVVLLNSLLHAGFSVWTHSYSPGVISGLLCWMPLGIYTLRRTWLELPRSSFGCGIVVSLCLHGLVSFSALSR